MYQSLTTVVNIIYLRLWSNCASITLQCSKHCTTVVNTALYKSKFTLPTYACTIAHAWSILSKEPIEESKLLCNSFMSS